MGATVRTMQMTILGSRALADNLYRVTIAANEKARQPPELDFAGLSTENYMRNPVVMWAHDAVGRSPSGGLPIGRTLRLNRTPTGEVVAEFEFLSDDPFAQRVKNAWDKGFLQAASISWVPLETVPVKGGGWRDLRADLLEWSIVSVPADPDALRESHRRLMDEVLGDRGQGTGTGEEDLALTPDDYDDLATAVALLRDIVQGIEARHASRRPPEDEEGEMAEVREMLNAIREAMGR